ncbi:MAG: DUF3343 domain-containing protein [Lachnospiraceae bacterium]
MGAKQCYVLFPNHDNGIRLYNHLKEAEIKATIAPTPRALSKCCGISLLIQEEDVERVRSVVAFSKVEIIDIMKLEKDINPQRDKYC